MDTTRLFKPGSITASPHRHVLDGDEWKQSRTELDGWILQRELPSAMCANTRPGSFLAEEMPGYWTLRRADENGLVPRHGHKVEKDWVKEWFRIDRILQDPETVRLLRGFDMAPYGCVNFVKRSIAGTEIVRGDIIVFRNHTEEPIKLHGAGAVVPLQLSDYEALRAVWDGTRVRDEQPWSNISPFECMRWDRLGDFLSDRGKWGKRCKVWKSKLSLVRIPDPNVGPAIDALLKSISVEA